MRIGIFKLFLSVFGLFLVGTSSVWALGVSVMSYNVENLFDTVDHPLYEDEEFTPRGRNEWTEEKLDQKMQRLAKVVLSVENEHGFPCPDVLGLQEVENKAVVEVWRDRYLKECNYRTLVIHRAATHGEAEDDPRGIRVALLSRLPLADKPSYMMPYKGSRAVLEVPLNAQGETLIVFVNHWKSRAGGGEEKRAMYARMLLERVKEINAQAPNLDIIILGDLNDEPEDESLTEHLNVANALNADFMDFSKTYLWNTSFNLFYMPGLIEEARRQGYDVKEVERTLRKRRGTYYFGREDIFNQLDHIILSRGLFNPGGLTYQGGSFEIYRHPEFTNKDGSPKPFFKWDPQRREIRLAGGASDHFPILARFVID